MTEIEASILKKIVKSKMVDEFYINMNVLLGTYHISNSQVSRLVGWDAAGYNQKLNRQSDLRLSTVMSICSAVSQAIHEGENISFEQYMEFQEIEFKKLFTYSEFQLGDLYLHITAAAEGREPFLNTKGREMTFRSLRHFVQNRRRTPQFTEAETAVFMRYYAPIEGA